MEKYYSQIHFMGKITAGASHEINNVLSVIKENAGLLEDLLIMAEKQALEIPFGDKIRKTVSAIKDTVRRGAEITSDLNTFSHISDHDKKTVKIAETISMVSRLNAKKASRADIKIYTEQLNGEIGTEAEPIIFSQLSYLLLSVLLDSIGNGKNITVTSNLENSKTEIRYMHDNQNSSVQKKIMNHTLYSEIMELASGLNATTSISDSGITLILK